MKNPKHLVSFLAVVFGLGLGLITAAEPTIVTAEVPVCDTPNDMVCYENPFFDDCTPSNPRFACLYTDWNSCEETYCGY